jgi:protein-tyrosine-phosphatase
LRLKNEQRRAAEKIFIASRVAANLRWSSVRQGAASPTLIAVNVLFVCENNSALSIMAEAILSSIAPGRFGAHSAGCFPAPVVQPEVVEFLATHHMPVARLRPKSLQTFRTPGGPRMDFIITLCDAAAETDYSAWPGSPFVAHWNVIDAYATGEADEALRDNFWTLQRRIKIFTSLPQGKLNRRVLERRALTLQPGYL